MGRRSKYQPDNVRVSQLALCDLASAIDKEPVPNRFIWKLLYILDSLDNAGGDFARANETKYLFHPLSSEILLKHLQIDYVACRHYLERHNIIQPHPKYKYQKGVSCMLFRLNYSYGKRDIVSTDNWDIGLYQKLYSQATVHRCRVTLNQEVFKNTPEMFKNSGEAITPQLWAKKRAFWIGVRGIKEGRYGFSIARSGRTSSVMNRFPRSVRSGVLLDGRPTVEVDMRSCQPTLLIPFLIDWYGKESLPEDVQRFISEVTEDDFYDSLVEIQPPLGTDRDEIKKAVMCILFGHNDSPWIGDLRFRFSVLYPSVTEYIEESNKKSNKGALGLAHELHSAEADLFINNISERFTNDFPEVPFISIHDGFRLPPDFAKAMGQMIQEEALEYTGYEQEVKIQYLDTIGRRIDIPHDAFYVNDVGGWESYESDNHTHSYIERICA